MVDLTDRAINVTEVIGRLAGLGEKALPAARIFFDFVPVPWGGAVVDALTVALPYLHGVSVAAPAIETLIKDGRPILEALQATAPSLVPDLKAIFAIAVNHDPNRPETNLTADDVSDDQIEAFSGSIFSRSFFTPQDQRFAIAQGNQGA